MKIQAMTNYFRRRFALPILLFLILLLDGSLQVMLLKNLGEVNYSMTSSLTIIALTILGIYCERVNLLYLSAIVLGFIFDTYYSRVLGVNLFIMPLICFTTRYFAQHFRINFYSVWFWTMIVYMSYGHLIYFIFSIFNLEKPQYGIFLFQHLLPSILFNGLMAFILNYCLEKFADWINK